MAKPGSILAQAACITAHGCIFRTRKRGNDAYFIKEMSKTRYNLRFCPKYRLSTLLNSGLCGFFLSVGGGPGKRAAS
jgi:hypothetical protein